MYLKDLQEKMYQLLIPKMKVKHRTIHEINANKGFKMMTLRDLINKLLGRETASANTTKKVATCTSS